MTRAEHLAWCKERALEYVDAGDSMNGLTSMFSDLEKHSETAGHPGTKIGMGLLMIGSLSDPKRAREFIEGFN